NDDYPYYLLNRTDENNGDLPTQPLAYYENPEVPQANAYMLEAMYNDGEFWHFMNNETFEQLSADAKAIGDNAKWLLDQAECIVTL
ncbi:portal protein, partial [Salmonella enterica subsp. enterica serovar Montevideo]|nr:portal protein [Salmonella enterica subsp. enterica serovar Montevideo]